MTCYIKLNKISYQVKRPSCLVVSTVHHKLWQGKRLQQFSAAAWRHAELRQEASADGGPRRSSPPAAHQRHQLHPTSSGQSELTGPEILQHALHRHRYATGGETRKWIHVWKMNAVYLTVSCIVFIVPLSFCAQIWIEQPKKPFY